MADKIPHIDVGDSGGNKWKIYSIIECSQLTHMVERAFSKLVKIAFSKCSNTISIYTSIYTTLHHISKMLMWYHVTWCAAM